MIGGQPGSGKGTLARTLAARTGLPVVHIDHVHCQARWLESPREEKTRLCRKVEAREAWIFEGGPSTTWATRLARADLLVWLDRLWAFDFGAWWSAARGTSAGRGRTCAEGRLITLRAMPDFLRVIWRTRKTARARLVRLASKAT